MSNPFTGNIYENSEKHKALVQKLSKQPQNRECADCDAKGPGWASWNLGVFICIKCAGIHRKLGTHISQVRSATLDKWTLQQAQNMEKVGGNLKANQYYERNKPQNVRKPSESDDFGTKEKYIRNKYEKKIWVEKGSDLYGDNSTTSSTSTDTVNTQNTTQGMNASVRKIENNSRIPVNNSVSSNSSRASNQAPSLIDFDSGRGNSTSSSSNRSDLLDLISVSGNSHTTPQVPISQQHQQQHQQHYQQVQQRQTSIQSNGQQFYQSDLLVDETTERNKTKASIMGLFEMQQVPQQPNYGMPQKTYGPPVNNLSMQPQARVPMNMNGMMNQQFPLYPTPNPYYPQTTPINMYGMQQPMMNQAPNYYNQAYRR